MRTLFRLCCLMLALVLGAVGGLGMWLEQKPDENPRELERVLVERARSLADERKLPPAERTRYQGHAQTLARSLAALGKPPAYGGCFGGAALLLGLALFVLRSPGAAEPASERKSRSQRDRGGKAKKSEKAAKAKPKSQPIAEAAEEPEEAGEQGSEDAGPSRRDRKKLLKAAAQIERDTGPEAAADYLVDAGLCDDAVEIFLREELTLRAAEVRRSQQKLAEAAELFVRGGACEVAARIYTELGEFEDAAQCYLAVDKKSVAAEMFEQASMYREAGDCYRDVGFGRHAAQAYLKGGAEAQAADALVQIFSEEGGVAAAKADSQVKEMRSIAKKAGDLLFKLERFEEAESILSRAGIFGAAAKVAFHRGNYGDAAEWFHKVGRGDLAARALEQAGDAQGSARAMGEYLREQGQLEEAAEYLTQAEEWGDAAGVYRNLERYTEAGHCYMRALDYGAAAEMYRAVQDFARAAEAYAQSRQPRLAAECYREAGDWVRQAGQLEAAGEHYEAGCLHAAHGGAEEAIQLLQRIPEDSPHFGDAAGVLGKLFAERGMDSLSIKKFEQATADTVVSPGTVEAYYGLARGLESHGDDVRALELYERILAFDYQYQDVSERIEQLKQRDAEQARAVESVSASGLGSGPTDESGDSRYQLVKEIGRGGMGVVYLARDGLLERDVAYKVLPEQLRENPDALRNFLREAKAAAQLNHPNIVTVYDVGESSHGYYLAMEYVAGTTLKQIVQKRGPVAPGGLVYILRQMVEALGYAHAKKVVHRDIKTANTMWTPDKQVKVMDFGLAKLLEEVRNATTTISGTPFYMSPEQTLGKNVDHRTDLYSLGVTLFELATGQLPFRRGNIPYHHVHTPAPDPRSLNPQLPAPLAEVILRCLEKAPDDRYPSAKHILEDLGRRMKGAGSAA